MSARHAATARRPLQVPGRGAVGPGAAPRARRRPLTVPGMEAITAERAAADANHDPAPPTEVGGFMPAASDRNEIVVPLRQSTPDWNAMCWLPVPGADPWQFCMQRRHHHKTCLPAPRDRGATR